MNLITKRNLDKTSLDSFIKDYFNQNQPTTYLKDTNRMQCSYGRRRSFTDILRLCSSYFECSPSDVAKVLISLWESRKIECVFCNTTRKVVFFNYAGYFDKNEIIHPQTFNPTNPKNVRMSYSNCGFNKPLTIGTDGIRFVDIYNLAKNSQQK